jgi:hypothetical protein
MCFAKDEQDGSPAVIGLAVPGRPIRSLVAEDRSAEGVRDQGPETQWVRAGSAGDR